MPNPQYLEEYLNYVHDNPDLEATHRFQCGAVRGKRPKLHNSLPGGSCFLYPDFLVFLTKSRSAVGWQTFFHNGLESAAGDWALFRWALKPEMVLSDLVKSVKAYLTPGDMQMSLRNPQSLFVPLRTVLDVKTQRDLTQGNYITLQTTDGDVVCAEHICDVPNTIGDLLKGRKPRFVTPQYLYKKVKGHLTGNWQPEFVAALRKATSHAQNVA